MADEMTEVVADDAQTAVMAGLSGASPAVPRDPRLLAAEQAEHEARAAVEQAEEMKRALEEAQAKAAAAKAAAEKSKVELEAAREEARAKAKAAALQVRMEQQEIDEAAAAALASQRAARASNLGTVAPVTDPVEAETVVVTKRSTDAFAGSLGLFLIRVVLAVWTGALGWQGLVNRSAVIDMLSTVGVPSGLGGYGVWLVGGGLIITAVFLLFGIATRFFATILTAGLVVFLVFFRFGAFSPFIEGSFGFYGDRELFAALMSLLLVLIGAGGWSIDAGVRKRRAAAKEQ